MAPPGVTMLVPKAKTEFGRDMERPMGNMNLPKVRRENAIAAFATMILRILTIRHVWWTVVQPWGSFFWQLPVWKAVNAGLQFRIKLGFQSVP